jgi:exonuclease III
MWGFECFFSSFSSNSRGVAILFNNNFEFKVLNEKKDINGNYLILDVIVEKERFTLVSLYRPNTDSPRYFEQVMALIDDFENQNYIHMYRYSVGISTLLLTRI